MDIEGKGDEMGGDLTHAGGSTLAERRGKGSEEGVRKSR